LGQQQNTASLSRLSVICQSVLSWSTLSYNLSYMAKSSSVSVRELQQNLKRVMTRVERGETVEVTRRNRPVARLSPARPSAAESDWPDLDARTRSVFGNRLVSPSGSQVVSDERGDR
jgi:prevent-host-death family protein